MMKSKLLKIKKICRKKVVRVSLAESCTGGLISSSLSSVGGSSIYFDCSLITYSNVSKVNLLNVRESLINKYGAVSKEVSISMAKNLFKITKNNLCISITGIAGPDGGTKLKPVGTVYITIIQNINNNIKKINTYKKNFKPKIRNIIQKKCNLFVLDEIIKIIN